MIKRCVSAILLCFLKEYVIEYNAIDGVFPCFTIEITKSFSVYVIFLIDFNIHSNT